MRARSFTLRLNGNTYQDIGRLLGVSRQRIQQLLKPPRAVAEEIKKRAHGRCEQCGLPGLSHHLHHRLATKRQEDTFNDLDNLQYLCPSCHRQAHWDMGPMRSRPCVECRQVFNSRNPRKEICSPRCMYRRHYRRKQKRALRLMRRGENG